MHTFLKSIALFLAANLILLFVFRFSSAESWEKIAEKGFHDPSNDYAWSMETFQGHIYVGTLNPMKGGQIWRSGSGEPDTWERVYRSFPLVNIGIRYLYNDNDQALYACTFNARGAQILRTTDGKQWRAVGRAGLGSRKNTTIRCMVRFGEYLYAGVGSAVAQLYHSKDGVNWNQVQTEPGFQSTMILDPKRNRWISNNIMIGELAVFNNYLYAFTWTIDLNLRNLPKIFDRKALSGSNQKLFLPTPGAFEVWRSNDAVNWEKVVGKDDDNGNGMGFRLHDAKNLGNDAVTSVTIFKDHMYLGTENTESQAAIWRTEEGTCWEKVLDFQEVGEGFNFYIWRMIPFRDKLYVGTMNMGTEEYQEGTGGQIWISDSGDEGSFYNLVDGGFDGETTTIMNREKPKNMGVRSFAVFEGHLLAGTATPLSFIVSRSGRRRGFTICGKNIGCEIWKMINADE